MLAGIETCEMRRTPGQVTFLGIALALVLSVALLACDQDEPGAAPTSTGSVETDREALVALYNATDGPNWRNVRVCSPFAFNPCGRAAAGRHSF